jgi:hypothetical protein
MRVGGMRFSRPIYIDNNENLSFIAIEHCDLLAGASDISPYPATARITLRGCRVEGEAFLKADGYCVVDSCVFYGHLVVGEENCSLLVTNSEFHGGAGDAMEFAVTTIGGGSDIFSASISDNLVERYGVGLGLYANDSVFIDNNRVRDCLGTGIDARADRITITKNRVERCEEYGISCFAIVSLTIADNQVADTRGYGIQAGAGGASNSIAGNVVRGSNLDGLLISTYGPPDTLNVKNNTCSLNGGSGFVSWAALQPYAFSRYSFTGNIGFRNGRYGVDWPSPDVTSVGCNDWFGNGLGAMNGRSPSSNDFEIDPLFCNAANGDFELFASSPLVDRAGCGLVGALGVGCDVTATTVSRFVGERVTDGIRIVWELGPHAMASDVWLERSESGEQGPWVRPVTERSQLVRAEVDLDRSVAEDRDYWYRLVASEGGAANVIASAIHVDAAAAPAFRLAGVGPNPSRGRVRIEFELRERAAIQLDVFDVQGRLVASPGTGVWPAGRHAVEWPNALATAQLRGGVYLLRYRFPGGEELRRLIRTP